MNIKRIFYQNNIKNTPNFYVDQVLKQKDESLVDELNQELDDLEKHRLSLITDPVYIGHEALKLYEEDDLPATLGRIKELVTIVKTKPYMTNQNIEIKGLLEQAETNLEEFANEMDNNNYLGEDTKIIEQRIEYLNQNIANLKKQEEEIIQKINDIDQKDVVAISNLLNNVENVYDKLKDEYEEYKNVIFQLDDDVSPRKKATLQSAYNRKKEEMDAVYKIYNSYQLELEKDVMKSSSLETTELTKVREENEKITKEVEELKKQKQGKTKIKDVLAIEKDKEKLKELSDKVEAIKHRQKYDQLPDEIYNDIEALLTGKARKEEDIKTPIINDDELVDLDEFRIEKLDDKEASPILDEIILEDKKEDKEEEKDEPQEETKIEDTKEINEKVLQIASEEQEKSSYPSRRIKVVKVEELKKEEPKEVLPIEEEISIPNLEEENKEEIESLNLNEDEYLNFNDILNGDYNEN